MKSHLGPEIDMYKIFTSPVTSYKLDVSIHTSTIIPSLNAFVKICHKFCKADDFKHLLCLNSQDKFW